MKTTKVYDLPTRIFHWLFAALFLGAFAVAKLVDDESASYSYHMLMGVVMALIVGLRAIWGIFGSRYARFSSFRLKPAELFAYFKRLVTGLTDRELGHNPASSWAAIIMFSLTLGLAVSGYIMTSGSNKEIAEEAHELFANAFIVVVIGHVVGVMFHSMRHRDQIAFSMVHGGKKPVANESGISHDHRGVAALFIALVVGFGFYLSQNFNPTTQELKLLGANLQLGESGREHTAHPATGGGHRDHQHDDD